MMPNERPKRLAATGLGGLLGVVAGIAVIAGAVMLVPPTPAPVVAQHSPGPLGSPAPSGAPSSSPAPSASALPASPTPSPTQPPEVRLQQRLDAIRLRQSIPGISVAIIWPDGHEWAGVSGLADEASARPVKPGTAFALASVSKTFTAAVVLQLAEEGAISLDAPVAPLLPDVAITLDPRITVRMLLDHTSGLPDFFLSPTIDKALQGDTAAEWTAEQALSYVDPEHADPGTQWTYANTNYVLLGLLVQKATGKPLSEEIRTRLLDPLGLRDTWYQGDEPPLAPEATGYSLRKVDGEWTHDALGGADSRGFMPFRSVITAAGGAGSMASTALDTARWIRAYASGRVVTAPTLAAMLDDMSLTAALGAEVPYGLGIQGIPVGTHAALGHSGRLLGFRGVARHLTSSGFTIVVLTNQSYRDPGKIASALMDLLIPQETPSPTPTPDASAGPSDEVDPVVSGDPSVLPDG